jgi:hypothetical protein
MCKGASPAHLSTTPNVPGAGAGPHVLLAPARVAECGLLGGSHRVTREEDPPNTSCTYGSNAAYRTVSQLVHEQIVGLQLLQHLEHRQQLAVPRVEQTQGHETRRGRGARADNRGLRPQGGTLAGGSVERVVATRRRGPSRQQTPGWLWTLLVGAGRVDALHQVGVQGAVARIAAIRPNQLQADRVESCRVSSDAWSRWWRWRSFGFPVAAAAVG